MSSEVNRPLADYPANIWEDPFASFSKSDLGSEIFKEKHSTLKEVVKESLMASIENPTKNIKFIDALYRLGVSYHFEKDIVEQLEKSFDNLDFNETIRQEQCDLYTVGILFQVFRQFGFKLSADVFEKFKDEDGKEVFIHFATRWTRVLYRVLHSLLLYRDMDARKRGRPEAGSHNSNGGGFKRSK